MNAHQFTTSRQYDQLTFFYDTRSRKLAYIEDFLSSSTIKKLQDAIQHRSYVVLGGDGLFIEIAKRATHDDAQILGINFGTKGFLLHDQSALAHDEPSFIIRQYPLLHADMMIGDEHFHGEAFNEIYLTRTAGAGSLGLSLSHAKNEIGNLVVDGLMVSTPAGTTGWSRNYGGHILRHSSAENLITPIGNRHISPIILPDKGRIRIENKALREHPYTLLADNRIVVREDTRPFELVVERARVMVNVLIEQAYLNTWDRKIYEEQGMTEIK